MHWDASKPGLPLFRKFVQDRVAEATKARAEIQSAPDDTMRLVLEQKQKQVEKSVELVRVIGDAVISAFFAEDKPRAREKRRATIESWVTGNWGAKWNELRAASASLLAEEHPLRPFHWAIEFPEVFARETPGFDAMVGTPPFLGGKRLSQMQGTKYNQWLVAGDPRASRNADLVAHFFRRAYDFIRQDGAFGLIATNTIRQGDTRDTGLSAILIGGGAVARAIRRLKWPGEAAVMVSVVHVRKGTVCSPNLDGRVVRRISAYLVEGEFDRAPARLVENARKAFQGSIALGMGFTFDDTAAAKGEAESLDTMRALISKDARNAERIRPYIGGDEVNTSPTHAHHRYIIDFAEFPLRHDAGLPSWAAAAKRDHDIWLRNGIVPSDYPEPVAADWPVLLGIVERRVKPQRQREKNKKYERMYFQWWKYWNARPGLYTTIAPQEWVLTRTRVSPHLAIARLRAGQVYSEQLIVVAYATLSPLAALQSRPHEVWARYFASSMKDDLRYTPSDCFETFPFPDGFDGSPDLEAAGQAYHDHRAAVMVAHNEGMTKTYNHFHDPDQLSEDIARLRELHAEMDRAVLHAYGWDDLAERAEPIFLDETTEDDHTYQGRLFWPSAFRDEVLARLLALNAERAAVERAGGLAVAVKEDEDEVVEETDT
jgi:hypothetical protein